MNNLPVNGQCACGKTDFQIHGKPLLRIICHCTICQQFNQAPFGDITFYRAKDIKMPAKKSVKYTAFQFPPIVQRGACVHCNKPVIEYIKGVPMLNLVIVPTVNIQPTALIPKPCMHIFYHSRRTDIRDNLPKHTGTLKSQLHLLHALFKAN